MILLFQNTHLSIIVGNSSIISGKSLDSYKGNNNKFLNYYQYDLDYEKASQIREGKEAEPSYMVVGSEKEKDVICDMLEIFEERILNTGLQIFDTIPYKHINNETDDFITIMFTWKPYEEHLYDFKESSYYKSVIEVGDMLSKYIDKSIYLKF